MLFRNSVDGLKALRFRDEELDSVQKYLHFSISLCYRIHVHLSACPYPKVVL